MDYIRRNITNGPANYLARFKDVWQRAHLCICREDIPVIPHKYGYNFRTSSESESQPFAPERVHGEKWEDEDLWQKQPGGGDSRKSKPMGELPSSCDYLQLPSGDEDKRDSVSQKRRISLDSADSARCFSRVAMRLLNYHALQNPTNLNVGSFRKQKWKWIRNMRGRRANGALRPHLIE